jgi:hypothetical protein
MLDLFERIPDISAALLLIFGPIREDEHRISDLRTHSVRTVDGEPDVLIDDLRSNPTLDIALCRRAQSHFQRHYDVPQGRKESNDEDNYAAQERCPAVPAS